MASDREERVKLRMTQAVQYAQLVDTLSTPRLEAASTIAMSIGENLAGVGIKLNINAVTVYVEACKRFAEACDQTVPEGPGRDMMAMVLETTMSAMGVAYRVALHEEAAEIDNGYWLKVLNGEATFPEADEEVADEGD